MWSKRHPILVAIAMCMALVAASATVSSASERPEEPAGTSSGGGNEHEDGLDHDHDHGEFVQPEDHFEYHVQFRSGFDFLSAERSHIERAMKFEPDGTNNLSLHELGLELFDDEWAELDRRTHLSDVVLPRVRSVVATTNLEDEEAFAFGEVYGGSWVDHADGGTLHLVVTDLDAIDAEAIYRLAPRGDKDIEISESANSYDVLMKEHDRIAALLAEAFERDATNGVLRSYPEHSVFISESDNRVIVLSDTDEVSDRLGRLDPSVVEIRRQSMPPIEEAGAPNTNHSIANQHAGIQIGVWDDSRINGSFCGWGFSGNSNPGSASGHTHLITAGHCVPGTAGVDDYTWYNDVEQAGGSNIWYADHAYTAAANTTKYDAARIAMYDGYANDNCYHGYSDCQFLMQSRRSLYSNSVGQLICSSLSVTNAYRCGRVTAWPYSGNGVSHRLQVDINVTGGDSGSGGKYSTTIVAILTDKGGSLAYYTPAWYVKYILGNSSFDYNCIKNTSGVWQACPIV